MELDEKYMRRALQLARLGYGFTSPNPMVGAVVVAEGRIIGEGYHRRFGGPHAEVWAVRSVNEKDRHLISRATMYVTLEPCSHYGKTPPCALMLVEYGFRKVVVGSLDPNPKVSGRGISILRDAGIEVITGVLESECLSLNRPFITAHTHQRPYVLLKWAQSADGFLDCSRSPEETPVKFSNVLSAQEMHRLRAGFDAILVGAGTAMADNPMLDVRLIDGRSPRPVIIDRRGLVPSSAKLFMNPSLIYVSSSERTDIPGLTTRVHVSADATVSEILMALKGVGVSSIMVEGGETVLNAFIEAGLWDEARIEVAPVCLGACGCHRMTMPSGILSAEPAAFGNVIINVKNAGAAAE